MNEFVSSFFDTLISILLFCAALGTVVLTVFFCWKGMWWFIPVGIVLIALIVTVFNWRN